VLAAQRPSLGEAHGGYTFCALASWVFLHPYLATDYEALRVNIPQLIRWLVNMQGIESDLGGFRGRTNKLVDGCYSWWVGGAFPLLEALGVSPGVPESVHAKDGTSHVNESAENVWDDMDGAPRVTVYHPETMLAYDEPDSLFDRRALQEYILLAGQHPAGGLRDKPPKCVMRFSKAYSYVFTLRIGIRTPTILHIASLACQLRNTVYALHLRNGKSCVRRGKVKMACVRLHFPSLSVGQRKAAALVFSARLRTALYVVLGLLDHEPAC
jgi:Prenyltransferase and squalene oxidase repeat